jgi:hypothetical protein
VKRQLAPVAWACAACGARWSVEQFTAWCAGRGRCPVCEAHSKATLDRNGVRPDTSAEPDEVPQ